MIKDAFSIPTDNQRLFYEGSELQDPTTTLLDLKINKNSVIHVLDTRDIK